MLNIKLASTTATDVGMHGLLAIVNRVTILCYPLVCVHCGPVEDFFITISRHPYILLISLEIFFIYLYSLCIDWNIIHKGLLAVLI